MSGFYAHRVSKFANTCKNYRPCQLDGRCRSYSSARLKCRRCGNPCKHTFQDFENNQEVAKRGRK